MTTPPDCGLEENVMVVRVIAVGVLVLAAMLVVKDGRILRSTGLTSQCLEIGRAHV